MTIIRVTWQGDSLVTPYSAYDVPSHRIFGAQYAQMLRKEGIYIRPRLYGVGGERSDQFLARADEVSSLENPAIAGFYSGINDETQGAPYNVSATIQANYQALIKCAKFGVKGVVAGGGPTVSGQANLPVGELGQRMVVMIDNSATGGALATHSSSTSRLTGNHSASAIQAVWECVNPGLLGELGWCRIAINTTIPDRCTRVIIPGYHYENFSGTAGDTPVAAKASNAALRTAQQAAVSAENVLVNSRDSVAYADVYTLMRTRIVNGQDPNYSSDTTIVATTTPFDATKAWHQVSNDLHLNKWGHYLLAVACRNATPAAWITELRALAPLTTKLAEDNL